MIIKDGTGKGYESKVDSKNRLSVRSVSADEEFSAAVAGNAYNLNTGLITGVGSDSALLYGKNTGDNDFVVTSLIVGEFEGITHSDDPYLEVYSNPTGGDIISDASAVSVAVNRNLGSPKTLSAIAYKGKNGGTTTGGTSMGIFQLTAGARTVIPFTLIVPKNSSLSFKYIANASSGTASIYIALVGFEYEA